MLARLRIRGRLLALVAVPLVLVLGLAVAVAADRSARAARASDTLAAVRAAGDVGRLVQELQEERLFSLGYLAGQTEESDLAEQSASVLDLARVARETVSGRPALAAAIDGVVALDPFRSRVLLEATNSHEIYAAFTRAIGDLIGSLRLTDAVDTASAAGRQLAALSAFIDASEANSQSAALLVILIQQPDDLAIQRYAASRAVADDAAGRFREFATPAEIGYLERMGRAYEARVGTNFALFFTDDPRGAVEPFSLDQLFPQMESFVVLGRFAERTIVTEASAEVEAAARRDLLLASVVTALALALPLIVVAFGLAVSAGIARPLIRLTRSADNVARAAEAELARVADDEAETNEPLRLEAVNVAARAEVGELARAFERIQVTAARLVERQVTSRRNVAQMFGHIGRRTQNMVGRQLDLIDLLEYEETDPERLRELYRLDHLASRLRRNASSLVVLSGMVDTSRYRAPISLAEVVRHALGEIEDYARVDIDVPELLVSPAIIGDLILMCAELMENATRFSPPHSRVTVTAGTVPAGAQVSIVDRGIGLSETRLADENARLARRERLDLVPTEVLGLFVVGRLARRHRVTVNLSHTHGGGITAALTLPNSVLVSGDIGATDPVAATTAPARRNALPTRIPAVDVGALQRLNEALDTGMTWNAFDPSAPVPSTRPPDAVPLPRQRVPGAQLPVASPAAVTTGAPSASDASAVRDLVGAFEGGVRRAQEQVRRPSGLTRRVPGATVGALATGPSPPAGTPQLDPLQALSRIKQIEQGVARALEEIRSDRERDEEPRR